MDRHALSVIVRNAPEDLRYPLFKASQHDRRLSLAAGSHTQPGWHTLFMGKSR
jgi:hypothetical protein